MNVLLIALQAPPLAGLDYSGLCWDYVGTMIKSYFETELGKLYNGDCLEVMQEMDDNGIDLVLTDPPYGIKTAMTGKTGKVGGGHVVPSTEYGYQEWDKKIPNKIYFDEMKRIGKNQIIFGGNYFAEYLDNSPCWIVWDKHITGNFADCELAWTSFKRAIKRYSILWNGMLRVEKEYKRTHPTQKPIRLFCHILEDFTKGNDLICDPYLGSGTTAIACERFNRKWIGIEISKQYCDIAVQRIKQETAQYKLELLR